MRGGVGFLTEFLTSADYLLSLVGVCEHIITPELSLLHNGLCNEFYCTFYIRGKSMYSIWFLI